MRRLHEGGQFSGSGGRHVTQAFASEECIAARDEAAAAEGRQREVAVWRGRGGVVRRACWSDIWGDDVVVQRCMGEI